MIQELGQKNSNTIQENISIYFYLISFHKMKIHSALLKKSSKGDDSDQSRIDDYKKDVEEWFVRWKELVILLAETQDTHQLLSWGELNYYHALFMISMLWSTPGVQALSLCDSISKAATSIARQQLYFSHLIQLDSQTNTHFIFPTNWTVGHLVAQVGLQLVSQDVNGSSPKPEVALAVGRCISLLSSLETDPSNLLTGQAILLESLYEMKATTK